MYGFLRPAKQYLSPESRKVYSQYYCGQCAALHDHFGYVSRVLTSYDAAFIGLLIAAQQDEEPSMDRRRCALFPNKLDVCSSNNPSSQISSALAVYFCSMRIEDKKQDGNSSFLSMQERMLHTSTKNACDMLSACGIPSTLATDVLGDQQTIEQIRTGRIIEYTRPTERFLSELFRTTAKITHKLENEEVLAQIGAALGGIIYLVDACVDLSEDLVKQEFNALMAAYAVDGELQRGTGDKVTGLIIQSLTEIRELLPRLELMRHREIIENILVVGLPLMIRREITRSLSRLKKIRPTLLRYAPHAALVSALCLFTEQRAEASEYGFACTDGKGGNMCIDTALNPFHYSWSSGCDVPFCIICQAPKAVATVFAVSILGEKLVQAMGDFRVKSAILKKEKEEKLKQKRQQDNAAYIDDSTKKLKRYGQTIHDKVSFLQQSQSYASVDYSFDKKIQRLISEAIKVKQDIIYSKDRKITEGINKITMEAKRLDKKLQAVCDSQAELKKTIASIRQSQKAKDKHIENYLKLYEELTCSSELTVLISDQRFEDYHAIAEKILAEVSIMAGNNNG